MGRSRRYPEKEAGKMMTRIIALSAAALIAAAPGAVARNLSGQTPDQQHQLSRKHVRTISGHAPRHATRVTTLKTGYPRAFGYVPGVPKDWSLESARQAGGGGGGGGGGGM
jgi:hypothetical protein